MYRRLYIALGPELLAEIVERARRERRRPQDEAALLIERALASERPVEQPAGQEVEQ